MSWVKTTIGGRHHDDEDELYLQDLIKHNHGNRGGGSTDSAAFSPGSSMSSVSTSTSNNSKHARTTNQQGQHRHSPHSPYQQHRPSYSREMLHRSSGMMLVEVGTPPLPPRKTTSVFAERDLKHGNVVCELQALLDYRRSKNGEL